MKEIAQEIHKEYSEILNLILPMGMAWMIALFWQQAITDTIKAFVPVSGAWPYEIGVAILTTLIGAGVVYLFKQNTLAKILSTDMNIRQ